MLKPGKIIGYSFIKTSGTAFLPKLADPASYTMFNASTNKLMIIDD
jgi:hypothetical protein